MYKHGLSEHDFQGLTKIKVSDVEKKIKQMQHVLSNNVDEPIQSEIFEQLANFLLQKPETIKSAMVNDFTNKKNKQKYIQSLCMRLMALPEYQLC